MKVGLMRTPVDGNELAIASSARLFPLKYLRYDTRRESGGDHISKEQKWVRLTSTYTLVVNATSIFSNVGPTSAVGTAETTDTKHEFGILRCWGRYSHGEQVKLLSFSTYIK